MANNSVTAEFAQIIRANSGDMRGSHKAVALCDAAAIAVGAA